MKMLVSFYGHLEHFTAIWYMYFMAIRSLGVVVIWYIFPVLVYCVKKNLATLNRNAASQIGFI
jgi:hypothetical protein